MKPGTIKYIALALVVLVAVIVGGRFVKKEIAKRQQPMDTSSVKIVAKKEPVGQSLPVVEEPIPAEPETEEEIIENDFYESVEAYEEVLQQELKDAYLGEIYYGYAYVNDDTLPELFVIRGDSHADTVSIYTIATATGMPAYVGDFGGFGSCEFVPRGGSIISSYGNQGYFFFVKTGMDENGNTFLEDIILRDGSQEECKSYYGFSAGGVTGAVKKGSDAVNMIPSPDETYLIGEDEADAIQARMTEGAMRVSMNNICTNILRKAGVV